MTVYILKCSDKSYYVGLTNDLTRRVIEHNSGMDKTCYTYYRRPVEVVFSKDFNEYSQAIEMEKKLKGWSRKKKEAFICGDFDLLIELSKSRRREN